MDDHTEYYRSLTYEDWCDLLSTIEFKDEREISAVHIKKVAADRASSLSDSDESVRVMRRKKAKTCVLRSNRSPRRSHYKHYGVQRCGVLCKKSGMPELKYMSHSAEDCTGVHIKRPIKDGVGGPIRGRTNGVQQYRKSENKFKKELKALRKQNKMLHSISNESGSRRDIRKIKKIRAKASKRTSVYSSDDLDSDSSLASDGS